MNLKGVNLIPPKYKRDTSKRLLRRTQTANEYGYSAFVNGDTLILDIYDREIRGAYIGRAAVDSFGRHRTLPVAFNIRTPKNAINLLGKEWTYKRVESLLTSTCYGPLGYLSWNCSMYPIDKESQEAFDYVLEGRPDGLEGIRDSQDSFEQRRYRMRQVRRQERIDKEMLKIKHAPKEFYDFCKDKIDVDVMIDAKKAGSYACTCCGYTHDWTEFENKLKLNRPVICPDTGKEAIYKGNKEISINKRVMFCDTNTEEKLVLRYFDARLTVNLHTDEHVYKSFNVTEVVRLVTGDKIYYGQSYYADENNQEWWDAKACYMRPMMTKKSYMYPTNLLEGSAYEHLGVEHAAMLGWELNYNNIMWMKDRYIEYVIKMGLQKLAYQMSQRSCWHAPMCHTRQPMLGLDKQRINRIKQLNGDYYVLEWLIQEKETSKKISDKTLKWLSTHRIHVDMVDFALKNMSPEQIVNYLKKQSKLSGDTIKQTLNTWADYIDMARKIDMDINDAIVYKTKDLKKRHDALVLEFEKIKDKKYIDQLAKKFPKVVKIYKKYSKYAYQNDSYMIIVPEGVGDIVAEGRALHHCVAASDRYMQRIENEETLILFLRKTDNPNVPYYTLEVEPGGTVRQKRTMYDRQDDNLAEVVEFLKEWQSYIKQYKEDKTAAKKSKEARVANFKELEKSKRVVPAGELAGQLLADVLKDDLMEVV